MKFGLRYGVALCAILVSGLAHGLSTGRWGPSSHALESARVRLVRLPLRLGDWEGTALPFSEREMSQSGAEGGVLRRYVNRSNGAVVSVLIVCGRPGPIAVHTPDICYDAAGFDALTAPSQFSVSLAKQGPSQQFWVADFRKSGAGGTSTLRIFWSWNAGGAWRAPTSPRLVFATAPALVKLYAVRDPAAPEEAVADDPALDLIAKLLPELASTATEKNER